MSWKKPGIGGEFVVPSNCQIVYPVHGIQVIGQFILTHSPPIRATH